MIRGVPGIWYCCDMARKAGKEGKIGSTRLELKLENEVLRREGKVAKIEWSGWSECSRLAIVTFSLLHCQMACRVDASDMVDMKKGVDCQLAEEEEKEEEEAALRSWLGFAGAV